MIYNYVYVRSKWCLLFMLRYWILTKLREECNIILHYNTSMMTWQPPSFTQLAPEQRRVV